jgi:hypothetical protein
MSLFYDHFFSTTALVVLLTLWLFKSRLSLYLALRREKASAGDIHVNVVRVPAHETCELNAWVDSLHGWAGRITVKRDLNGSDGSFIVACARYRYHSGPPDAEALYIDGKKLKANSSCKVGPQSLLILRQRAVAPSIVQVRLV